MIVTDEESREQFAIEHSVVSIQPAALVGRTD